MSDDGKKLQSYFQDGDVEAIGVDLIALIVKLLEELRTSVGDLKSEQHSMLESFHLMESNAIAFENTLRDHARESSARHKQLLSAYPAEDIEGHRRYHESVIEWRELRNKMVREALIKCASAGALAGLGWLLYAIWLAVKFELSK